MNANNFAELSQTYQVHRNEFYAFAMRLTRNPERAEDLLQETMLKAMSSWHQYTQGSNLRAWLFCIMRNTFINECRKSKRHHKYVESVQKAEPPVEVLPDDEVIREQESKLLRGAIEELSTHHQDVIELAEIKQLRYQEVAKRLNVPVGTVMSRLHRAKKALHRVLEPALSLQAA